MYKCDWEGFYQIAFTNIFRIYIIMFFTVHIGVIKALRNPIAEKPIYLLNTAFYNFFDFGTLLSSMPINKKDALEILS